MVVRNQTSRLALIVAPFLALVACAALGATRSQQDQPKIIPEAAQFFETKVRPLLAEKCYGCHGSGEQKGGLRLDSREAVLRGSTNGPIVSQADATDCRLVKAIHYEGATKMPPAGKLTAAEIEALEAWVRMGTVWPSPPSPLSQERERGSNVQVRATSSPSPVLGGRGRGFGANFWSFQPVHRPAVPIIRNQKTRIANPIDSFILARLQAAGLHPAPRADRRTLIRRAYFDLIGLPPTPAEVEAFINDRSPHAWGKVVDHLLASPHYGERWARHWLDVVRYCDSLDSRGSGSDGDLSEIWRYRDWVVDALNRDMSYTDFIRNQIAGDLLPSTPPLHHSIAPAYLRGAGDVNAAGIIATGMLACGNWGNGDADKDKILTDIADDNVDVVSRAFMGLTVGCARCHDHKFDPISQRDYYALAGIFFSTHILPKLTPKGAGEVMLRIPLVSPAEVAARATHDATLASKEKQLESERNRRTADYVNTMLPETPKYLVAAWKYANRPPAAAKQTLAEFAFQEGVAEYALRQWVEYFGSGGYRVMSTPVRDVLGNAGVLAWKGPNDTPSATINTTDAAKPILTFTLPPRSVSIHPGPANGVVASWRSPITGVVAIKGRVVDADPAGGDGIAWAVDLRHAAGLRELASGDIPNGGSDAFGPEKRESLREVVVRAGEMIQLVVLPKMSHTCDTTTVELTITEAGGKRVWDLTRDLLKDPLAGNPHADSFGNADTWAFLDMADAKRVGASGVAGGDAWAKAVALPDGPTKPAAIQSAAEELAKGLRAADASSPFWIRRAEDERYLPAADQPVLARLRGEIDELKRTTPPPIVYANGAQDGGVPESPHAGAHDVAIHMRGRYDRLGAMVPRGVPTVIAGQGMKPIAAGSGRVELADWLCSPSHPLTARVIVNRIWQHHFGEGIVRTPGNFGFLGERPTHPELLDWLASELVAKNWSMKSLHRMIMLSETYQASSIPPKEQLEKDPDNRLFGRQNRRRLEAEALRDSLLAASGKLDQSIGGPAERDPNKPRRGLYMITIRSDRTGFGPLFDLADSTSIVDRRTVSTVAPQALYLLNSPFALTQAKALADRLLKEAPTDVERIRAAYPLLYGRPATADEVKIGMAFLAHARNTPRAATHGPRLASVPAIYRIDEKAWEQYAQILLCANEFIYID